MKTIRIFSGVALAFSLLAVSGEAGAAPPSAFAASELGPKTERELRAEIEKAHRDTPDLVRQVQDIAARARELDAASRVPGMPFTRQLRALGPRAFYPMLELLVFDAHTEKDLPATAASALRLGLIEAIGSVRDARAVPVMGHLLEQGREVETLRAASEALARIGTDEALALVVAAANKEHTPAGNPRERAVLSGLHDCRRAAAARFLAQRLDAGPDAETARVLVKALGGVGNAWAWKTFADRSEEGAARGAAAQALVRAFVRYGGEVREAAQKALLVVDDASTPGLVAKAKSGAPRDVAAALDELDRKLAKNPAR